MSTANRIPRKRNRKRKRRAVSVSSSSSSSSESSDSDTPVKLPPKPVQPPSEPSSSSSSSSSESSSSDSEDDHAPEPVEELKRPQRRPPSRSPSPPPVHIPSFLPEPEQDGGKKEQELRDKFKKFWMASVADAFKDDLEQIRKEPNLTTTKLSLLIDSLASGADVFTSSTRPGHREDVNEMQVVLEHPM